MSKWFEVGRIASTGVCSSSGQNDLIFPWNIVLSWKPVTTGTYKRTSYIYILTHVWICFYTCLYIDSCGSVSTLLNTCCHIEKFTGDKQPDWIAKTRIFSSQVMEHKINAFSRNLSIQGTECILGQREIIQSCSGNIWRSETFLWVDIILCEKKKWGF